tara:strand:+ start:95 stop:277 length:183 start_codon:yes stop_codon:yes gene_type:complete
VRRSLPVIHQRSNRLLYFFQRHGVSLHELSERWPTLSKAVEQQIMLLVGYLTVLQSGKTF